MADKTEKVDKKERAELIRATRIASANPFVEDFWDEVGENLDRLEADRNPKVESR